MAKTKTGARITAAPKALASYQAEIVTAPWYETLASGKERARIDTFLKSRRVGGSVAAAYRAALWGAGIELTSERTADGKPKANVREAMDVIVVSKDFKSAKKLLTEVADACEDLARMGPEFDADIQQTSIKLRNGHVIDAIACSDKAIRGNTAAVIADEFAFWRQPEACWGAIKSVTDPNYKYEKGLPALFVTSAWEAGSLAHRIFTDPEFPFGRYSVDIHQAVAAGFPVDPEEEFARLGFPELIGTEYLCQWMRGGDSFFPIAKLRDCQVDDGEDEFKRHVSGLPDGWQDAPLYIGIDVGGGKGRDNTAIVCWRAIGTDCWMTGVTAFNRKEPVEQWDEIEALIRRDAHANTPIVVAVDAGFEGTPLMSELRRRFRKWPRLRFIGLSMAVQQQERYAKATRLALEHGRIKLYTGTDAGGEEHGARALMLEMSQLKTKPGAGGHLTFATPRDVSKGHCDRAWAAMFGLSRITGVATAEGIAASGPAHVPQIITYESPMNF
jgi:hypothetical protein